MKWLAALSLLAITACGGGEPDPADNATNTQAPVKAGEAPLVAEGATADRRYPFEGLWANSFTNCSLAPGSAEAAPIAIEGNQFIGYENRCTITEVVSLSSESRYEASLKCLAEGQQTDTDVYLRLSGDTLMFQWAETQSVTWTRCPGSAP